MVQSTAARNKLPLVNTMAWTPNLTLHCAVAIVFYNFHMSSFLTNKIANSLTLETRSPWPGPCQMCSHLALANIYSLSPVCNLHARHFPRYLIYLCIVSWRILWWRYDYHNFWSEEAETGSSMLNHLWCYISWWIAIQVLNFRSGCWIMGLSRPILSLLLQLV